MCLSYARQRTSRSFLLFSTWSRACEARRFVEGEVEVEAVG